MDDKRPYLTSLIASPSEVARALGRRAQQRRIGMGLRQLDLAKKAGVSLRTLRRFEAGEGTLDTMLRVAFALGAEREFLDAFPAHDARTLDDILAANRQRRRART